jgi:hypothetical protein
MSSEDVVNKKADFVKLITDFTKDVLTTFPELADTLDENLRQIVVVEEGSEPSDENIDAVWNVCADVYPPRFFDILYQNVEIFEEGNDADVHFLPGIDFRTLWGQDISDKTRETIWKYLQLILLRVVSETSEERSFGETAKLFEAIDENVLKEKLEQTIKDMETMFNASGNGEDGQEGQTGEDGQEGQTGEGVNPGDLPNPEDIHNHITGLMKGKLGRLAQEIAEETAKDLSDELGDVKSADQIFHKLFKNPGKLMSLVKKVGNRLEEKIKSGEIKESELLKEASEFMTKMKDMPGMGNMKNVLGQMGMPGLGKDMKLNMGALNGMMRGAQARDRLRAKLAKKQQERQQQAGASGTSVATTEVKTSTFSTGEAVEKSSRKPAAPTVEEQTPTETSVATEQPATTSTTEGQKKKPKNKKKNKNRKK